jgi:hypothetical protein
MSNSEIPKDGHNPYAHHPGFESGGCPIRYTVTQRSPYGAMTGGGFGCEITGGLCLPGEHCEARRTEAARQDAFRAIVDKIRDQPKVVVFHYD